MAARWDVLFDGDCGICDAGREFGERADWFGVFRWRAARDPEVARDHPHLDATALDRAMHVAGPGVSLSGFDAVRFIALRLPPTAPAGVLMHLPGIAPLGRAVYGWVARNRKQALACRLGEPTILHRWAASVLILAVLGLAGGGAALNREDWPLTSAPMFANEVEADGARYAFRFLGEPRKGKAVEIPADACGIPELRLKRIFFGRFYGSVDPGYEYGAFPGDTPEAFDARMGDFFGRFADAARERGNLDAAFVRIRLQVVRQAGGRTERFDVGAWDIRRREFRRAR
ncbi:MAG: DUF393 domain-containing protein [Candidatus Brocadiae bacterium]|nr:DUF393 domain-containing protein [Candidatus Brocadiia bacterium]